ncbi:MAG: sugar transferase [Culicoidibacterales bacterium]
MRRSNKMQLFLKRAMDILVSFVALILLSPILLIIALLVRIKLGSPILFTQQRPGKDKKIFKMYKFRTMLDAVDKNGIPLPDEQRLTKFGKLLRSTSLDELPELWNVLKGDMSLVGPRPLLEEYLPLYSQEQLKRHNVRPGVTGLAQVKGRNSIDWTTKFAYDIEYVEKMSIWQDIRILWLTVETVLKREGINSAEHVTMEKFNGNN